MLHNNVTIHNKKVRRHSIRYSDIRKHLFLLFNCLHFFWIDMYFLFKKLSDCIFRSLASVSGHWLFSQKLPTCYHIEVLNWRFVDDVEDFIKETVKQNGSSYWALRDHLNYNLKTTANIIFAHSFLLFKFKSKLILEWFY